MNRSTLTRIGWVLGALVVIGLVGAAAFWAGARYSGGWMASAMPQMMNPGIQNMPGAQGTEGVQNMPGMWMRGHGGMGGFGGWSFGPFSLIFGGLRFLFFIGAIFLAIALFRRLFFGWGHRPWHGYGPQGFEARAHERFEAWHKEAHGGATPSSEPPTTPAS